MMEQVNTEGMPNAWTVETPLDPVKTTGEGFTPQRESNQLYMDWDTAEELSKPVANSQQQQAQPQQQQAQPQQQQLQTQTEQQQQLVQPPVDVNSREFQSLNEQAKRVLGVDLKEAYQLMQQMSQQIERFQPYVQQMQVQQAHNQLQALWGVSGYEYQQRLNQLAEYAKTLSPELAEEYDRMGVHGLDLMYRRMLDTVRPTTVQPFDRPSRPSYETQKPMDEETLMSMLRDGTAARNWDKIIRQFSA